MIESSPVFVDGFGRRVVRVSRDEPPVELLHLDSALAEHRRLCRRPPRTRHQAAAACASPRTPAPSASRPTPWAALTLVSRVREGVAPGRPARRGRNREPDVRHRRRHAAAAAAAADGGDAVEPESRYGQRRARPRAPVAHAPGAGGAHRLRARLGHRDAGLGSRTAVAVVAGGGAADRYRRPGRVAARRRRPGRRHDALAGRRPPSS